MRPFLRTSLTRPSVVALAWLTLASSTWAAAPAPVPALKAPLAGASSAQTVVATPKPLPPPSAKAAPATVVVPPLPAVVGKVTPAPAPATPVPPAAKPPAASGPDRVGPIAFKLAKIKVYTGNDNKEAPSAVWATLYINGGAADDNGGLNPDRLQQLTTVRLGNNVELRPNSVSESVMEPSAGAAARAFEQLQANTWGEADRRALALCQQHGLRLEIKYDPNFALDAWEIKRVDLDVDFGSWEGWVLNYGNGQSSWRFLEKPAPGYPRTITFNRSARLSDGNRKLVLVTDGFFFPK